MCARGALPLRNAVHQEAFAQHRFPITLPPGELQNVSHVHGEDLALALGRQKETFALG